MWNEIFAINWIAVAVATFASFVLGGLWFTALFGGTYKVALGRENEPDEPPAPIFIVGPLVCTLITTITSAIILRLLKIESVRDGVIYGVIVGLGYQVATMTNTAINPNMPHPLAYSAISGPYFLIGSILSSVILVAMRKH